MTPRPFAFRPAAARDAAALAAWYAEQGGLALELAFIDALQATLDLLCRHPAAGSPRHALLFPELPSPLRFHPVRRFGSILVYYLELSDRVEVVRIWDAARGLTALLDAREDAGEEQLHEDSA